MRALCLLWLVCTGCSAGRFASLSPGTYDCTASVTLNTCEVTLTPTPEAIPVSVGGDVVSLLLPSSSALFAAPEVPWDSAQFGAQANPLSYYVSGSSACGASPVGIVSDAQITRLGDDSLEIVATHRYTDAAACAPVSACELSFDVSCARRL